MPLLGASWEEAAAAGGLEARGPVECLSVLAEALSRLVRAGLIFDGTHRCSFMSPFECVSLQGKQPWLLRSVPLSENNVTREIRTL